MSQKKIDDNKIKNILEVYPDNLDDANDLMFDIFMLTKNRFDNTFKDGNYHPDHINTVAMMTKDYYIHRHIGNEQKNRYSHPPLNNKPANPEDKLIRIRLNNGEEDTYRHRDLIKSKGFSWDKEFKDWYQSMKISEWNILGKTFPFDKFSIKIEE